jgi:hypothetical protein
MKGIVQDMKGELYMNSSYQLRFFITPEKKTPKHVPVFSFCGC